MGISVVWLQLKCGPIYWEAFQDMHMYMHEF